jgi:RNA polymerase sigma factor (sigma-70 family)
MVPSSSPRCPQAAPRKVTATRASAAPRARRTPRDTSHWFRGGAGFVTRSVGVGDRRPPKQSRISHAPTSIVPPLGERGVSRASHLDLPVGFGHLGLTVSRFGKEVAGALDAPSPAPVVTPRPDELRPLANAAATGDPDAAATLVLHLGGPMLRVVRKVLGRRHPDVDDVAQDAVIAFLRALNSFRGECSVVHFASRVSLLTALAARRRLRLRSRWAETDGQPIENVPDEEVRSPLSTALASRRRQLVHQLLDDLPDVIAESLALHFVLGYTVDEIGAAISVSPNTVWSRLRLGKRALRRKLEADAQLAEMLEVTK